MDFKKLKHFVLLADTLSFSRASELAYLTQSAFSRSIQAFEEELGLVLFDRSTRTVAITPVGKQVLRQARGVLSAAQSLNNEVLGITQGKEGLLRFGVTLLGVATVMRGAIVSLVERSPGLDIDIEVGNWEAMLEQLDADVIEFFVGYSGHLSDLSSYSVKELPGHATSIFANPHHPILQQSTFITRSELLEHPWAMIHAGKDAKNLIMRNLELPENLSLPIKFTCDNLPLLRELVLKTPLLLFTWCDWVEEDVRAGRLIDVTARLKPSVPSHYLQLPCAIVSRAGQTLSPAANRMIALIEGGTADFSTFAKGLVETTVRGRSNTSSPESITEVEL